MGDQHGATTEEEIIFRSPFPAVAIPENMNVPQFVLSIDGNDKYADNVALVEASTGKEYTYAQVISLTKRVAAALVGTLGVQKGDVVLLLLPNMAEYPIIVLGIMLAGAVFSGINPSAHVTEIEKQMQDSGARLLVTISSIYEKLRPLAFMSGVTIIMADEEQQVADGNSVPLAKFFSTTDSFSASLPEVNDSDLCALPYSSGTTGASKGVMLSHRNLIANLCSTLFDVDESVLGKFTTLGLMPFFHIYGITGICCATLRNRGKVVVMSRFDLRQFMDALINYDVNFAPIVPPIMLALVKNPIVNEYDLARLQLKAIMTAAAPLAPDLQRAFHEKFPGVEVQEAYGLTEHSCITLTHCAPTNNIRGRAKRKSVGFILPNLEVKFIDPETGKSLPRNCTGEICVRSQCVMRGYYQKPRETEMTLDTEGWLHTGDVGFIDDDDDVFIVDRIKELIKYKGFQVAPAELEAILLSHPSVDDAAVVPLADEEAGEIPVAFVVKAASATETEEDISKFVASQVSGYKKVRAVHFVASIPKSSSGKILRRLLRDNLVNQTTVIVSSD